jgi:predicted MFS family arabinose efflux permease
LLAYQLTRSVFAVGLVVSAQFAGILVLSPWAAVVANRFGSRATLIGSQVASALIAGSMALTHHAHMLDENMLVLGALGLGFAFSLALPLQTAMVPTLVDLPDTEAAMAMNSVSYNSGRALAPALCVLVLAFTGPGWIFGLNALSFAVFAMVLSRLKPDANDETLPVRSDEEARELRRARVMDGFRTARRHRRIFLLLAIVAAVTLADDPILVLSPGLAHTTLHVSRDWAEYFIAALGWGTVLGSLPPTTRRRAANPSHASRRAAWSLLALAISVVIFATGFSAWVSLLAAFATGAAALFTGAATQALIVGPHRKAAASVAGLWAIAWAGTKPIASLLDGWLASHFGILTASVALASPALALALCELAFPFEIKQRIKSWSLTEHLPPYGIPSRIPIVRSLRRPDHPARADAGTAQGCQVDQLV